MVLLPKIDLAIRTVRGAPPLHASLQRAQLAGVIPIRVLLHQQLEQRLGFELGR
jgi:hypothetical protein